MYHQRWPTAVIPLLSSLIKDNVARMTSSYRQLTIKLGKRQKCKPKLRYNLLWSYSNNEWRPTNNCSRCSLQSHKTKRKIAQLIGVYCSSMRTSKWSSLVPSSCARRRRLSVMRSVKMNAVAQQVALIAILPSQPKEDRWLRHKKRGSRARALKLLGRGKAQRVIVSNVPRLQAIANPCKNYTFRLRRWWVLRRRLVKI